MGGQGPRARVILVLREFVWNVPAILFVLSAFDDTGSLGSTLVTASRFLAGKRAAEMKPRNPPFYLHFYFPVFLCLSSFLLLLAPPSDIAP